MKAKLLVSVRGAAEAKIAIRAGVDVLDVKDPTRGSLGAADQQLIHAVVAEGRKGKQPVPISAAMGELVDDCKLQETLGVQWVKMGLAKCAGEGNWQTPWRERMARFPMSNPIAVIYADTELADSPTDEEILKLAREEKCAGVLIDTFVKDGRSLLDFASMERLRDIRGMSQEAGCFLAVAGSLKLEHLPVIAPLQAEVIAVRGAVCATGRTSEVVASKIENFKRQMAYYLG